MAIKEILSGRLRMLRTVSRMTQKQVAQILNLDRSTYAYYETATTCPDYATLVRFAKMYRVSADYLLGMKDSPEVQTTALAQEETGAPLAAATLEEKQCLLTFRMMTPEEQQELLSAAQSILGGGRQPEK